MPLQNARHLLGFRSDTLLGREPSTKLIKSFRRGPFLRNLEKFSCTKSCANKRFSSNFAAFVCLTNYFFGTEREARIEIVNLYKFEWNCFSCWVAAVYEYAESLSLRLSDFVRKVVTSSVKQWSRTGPAIVERVFARLAAHFCLLWVLVFGAKNIYLPRTEEERGWNVEQTVPWAWPAYKSEIDATDSPPADLPHLLTNNFVCICHEE